jgi:hypothetical protein
MKKTIFWALGIIVVLAGVSETQTVIRPWSDFPRLQGPYLGQKPPVGKAELFAPGIVSTGMTERSLAATKDGLEIFFEQSPGRVVTIMTTRFFDGRWTEPIVASFASDLKYYYFEPALSADEKTIFFLTTRPRAGESPKPGWGNQSIWASDRGPDGRWGEAYDIGGPINTGAGEFFPSLTNDGTLYFTRTKAPGEKSLIMRSRRRDGRYQTPEALPEAVNGKAVAYNACIAPDESYLIACVDGRDDSLTPKRPNYYVFFRSPDDRWSEGLNLGPEVNFPGAAAQAPYVTRDGRYLFFGSTRSRDFDSASSALPTSRRLLEYFAGPLNGSSDVYWIDTSFIEKLRLKARY